MLSFCQWLQSTAFFTELRGSGIVYPTVLSLHVLAIAMFGVMILVTDVRLLGGMRKYPVAEILDKLRTPKRVGFTLIVTCGLLLFGAKAEEYYYNPFFRMKMSILLLILIHGALFRAGVYRNGAALDAGGLTGQARLAGGLSLALWLGMVICGRGIGYIEPNLFILHARIELIQTTPAGAPVLSPGVPRTETGVHASTLLRRVAA
jgi:hypothetical protein